MPGLTSLYGQVLLLVVIVCGLVWMVAPDVGRQIASRGVLSLLLFIGGSMLAAAPRHSLFLGTAQLVLAFVLILASLLCLIDLPRAAALLGTGVVLGLGGIVL